MKNTAQVTQGGRIVIPAHVRKKMNLKEGSIVAFELKDQELKITPVSKLVRQAQAICEPYLKKGKKSLVDEFLRDRRKEAAREYREDVGG